MDGGVPVGTCLMLFGNWLQEMKDKKGFKFPCEDGQKQDQENDRDGWIKWCTFVTWSDWDLGTCLKNECKRKQLRMPHSLRSWIDLRATYRNFYCRKPQGLAGALQDLGLKFSGREHSGLDDARNTARVAWRMISDGRIMQITKSLDWVLEKLCETVTQTGHLKTDLVVKDDMKPTTKTCLKLCHDGKENSLTAASTRKPQVQQCTLSERKIYKSLHVSSEQAESQSGVESTGLCTQRDINANKEVTVDYSLRKVTIAEKDHTAETEEKEAKNGRNASLVSPLTCLKRRAPQDIVGLAYVHARPITSESSDNTFKRLITPLTSLSSLTKRARGSFGEFNSETPKSSTSGLLLKRGLVKQTLSVKHDTALGRKNQRTSHGVKQSDSSKTCKPVNIAMNAVTTPSLKVSANQVFLQEKNLKKQNLNNKNCPFTRPFYTPYSNRKENYSHFTPSSVKTKLNSSVTPPIACFNGGGVTPPLCQCGRRTRRRSVVNPGPNQGGAFFACSSSRGQLGLGTNSTDKKAKRGCSFFRWEVNM